MFQDDKTRQEVIEKLETENWPNVKFESSFIKPSHWDTKMVADFLKTVHLSADETVYDRYGENFATASGAALIKVKNALEIQKQFDIVDHSHAVILNTALSQLKANGDSFFNIIAARHKFESSSTESTMNILEAVRLTGESLGDKAVILQKLNEMNKIKETVSDTRKLIVEPGNIAKAIHDASNAKKLRVRLVITEIAPPSHMKMKKFQNSMMNLLPVTLLEYGMFHTALIIGNSYIEWTTANLIIPRRISSQNAVFVTDLNPFMNMEVKSTVETWETISEVICYWNAHYTYHKTKRNCQHFVEAILEALNVQLTFKGPFKEYLSTIKKTGESKMMYKLKPEIQNALHYQDDMVEFTSHEKLDEFVLQLKQAFPNFHVDYAEDYALLKGFDRALWLKFVKAQTQHDVPSDVMKSIQPLSKGTKTTCPFLDPRLTESFV